MVSKAKIKRYLKIIVIIIIIYYAVIIFTPLSRWLADSLVVGSLVGQADVIIVLSAGSIHQQYLHHQTLNRLIQGIILWRQGKAPNLIVSGGPSKGRGISDAYLMAEMAKKLGVKADKIFLEDKSLNTRENISYCARLMKRNGWRMALLVTSSLHMKRVLQLAEKEGIKCLPAADPYYERYLSHYQLFQLVKHEYLAMLAYKCFSERGLRILDFINRWLTRLKDKIFYY